MAPVKDLHDDECIFGYGCTRIRLVFHICFDVGVIRMFFGSG